MPRAPLPWGSAPMGGGEKKVKFPPHPGLDPGSMNTGVRNLEPPCSWVPAFAGMTLCRRGGLVMLGHSLRHEELEQGEGGEADGGAGDVEEPEGGRVHGGIELADLADDLVGREEGEIIEADDGGVDLPGRDLGEEREADGQDAGEADAVQQVEHDRPEQADLAAALG